ncbi:MAG: DNA-3-methyladenine glycosylase 2 family protein [Bacteroidetes bacterium]|nr:MAG: DNA-3-methyladenine glycosylase 2 family protein [Bacteroidota bacterium]
MNATIRQYLCRDAVLCPLVETLTIPPVSNRSGNLYADLIRSIVGQQLSVKAAQTIYDRFMTLFPDGYAHPDDILRLDADTLRSVGLSGQKAAYIQNVAAFFRSEKLENKDWSDMTDDEIVDYLTQIKGVGRWTVEMILMFSLDRPDVFPHDDLGIQNTMKALYGLDHSGKALIQKMKAIAEPWRPYRTYACRLLWRWKDQ